MDIFHNRDFSPMLIGASQEPFDDENYIFELKLDGSRCLAFLDKDETDLINKRGIHLISAFPELKQLHKQVKTPCILDGELFVFKHGTVDFYEMQHRSHLKDSFKISLAAKKSPATFTAFDVLYYKGNDLTKEPLMKRKKILNQIVKENERINVSRYIETFGTKLYELTVNQHLEGIVAKPKNSIYHINKRTNDWIKIKNLLDDDFAVAGYIEKDKGIISLVLAQYQKKQWIYMGHVTMGVRNLNFIKEYHCNIVSTSPFSSIPSGNESAHWLSPMPVCTVKYMDKTASGGLRQPIFKGFRDDKDAKSCIHTP